MEFVAKSILLIKSKLKAGKNEIIFMSAITFVREEEKMARHAMALRGEASFFIRKLMRPLRLVLAFFGSFWGNAKKNMKN